MQCHAVRTRVWRNGKLEAENFPWEQVSDYLEQPDTLVWADLLKPDDEFLATIAEELSLDPHSVEDAKEANERPKAMRYPTHLFLTVDPVVGAPGDHDVTLGRVSAFSTKQAFVTVRLDDTLDLDAVVHRWEENSELLTFGPRALVHGLLDEIVDTYFQVLTYLDDRIEGLEDLLFTDTNKASHQVSQMAFRLRRALVHSRRAMVPMREVVNTITRHVELDTHEADLRPFFDDLDDHVLRVEDWIDSLRDSIQSVFDTNMSLSDSRMNLIMKKLTSWAAIVAVPTAITGYFGQNVPYPGVGDHWGFWLSTVSMIIVAIALYGVFKRKDWL